MGAYPEVSLADAREARDEARKLLRERTDPSAKRQAEKAARTAVAGNSFESVAREWHAKFADTWAPSHADRVMLDLDKAEWSFVVPKTKTPHVVPLAQQAVAILRDLQPLTGNCAFVFPGGRTNTRPMSENAVLAALRRMGVPKETASGHGFRATVQTILDEVLGSPPHLLEHQLAHSVRDPLGRSYNRTTHQPQRRKMMEEWANHLTKLKADVKVIPFKRAGASGA